MSELTVFVPEVRRTRAGFVLLAALAFAAPAAAAAGPNLITNSSFDVDVSSWAAPTPSAGSLAWDPTDVAGSSSSGSARVVNTATIPDVGTAARSECLPGLASSTYDVRADVFIPTGQATTGDPRIFVSFYSGADCTGPLGNIQFNAPGSTPGTWTEIAETRTIGDFFPGSQTAQVLLVSVKEQDSGSFAGLFDRVEYRIQEPPTPALPALGTPGLAALAAALLGASWVVVRKAERGRSRPSPG